jgi:4-carboxymuconolactone decarboxylase
MASQEQQAPAPQATQSAAEGMRVYKAIPHLGRIRDEVLFGDVWKAPELGARDRSLVTCAVLAALGRTDELAVHVLRAAENGVTADEIRGMAVHIAFYAGWPAGIAVGRAALPLLEADGKDR